MPVAVDMASVLASAMPTPVISYFLLVAVSVAVEPAVIERVARLTDPQALHAMLGGVRVDLSTEAAAQASAQALQKALVAEMAKCPSASGCAPLDTLIRTLKSYMERLPGRRRQ